MRYFYKTDIGKIREHNQDTVRCGLLDDQAAWAIVCDGMGGANAGNIASEMAIECIAGQITLAYRPQMSNNSIKTMLQTAIFNANIAVFGATAKDERLIGMGTTAVVVLISDGIAHIAHVGDSRAYHLTKEKIAQVTTDHSVVQEMINKGKITLAEAKSHPQKNIITRAIGVDSEINADYNEIKLAAEDVVILCSDGLSNYIDSDEIYMLAQSGYDDLCDVLIAKANELGGSDNITIAILLQ